ncbi:MAG: MarR family transcriptional regulator [Clostridia bacterium]|nr:MarR family transcriptional regulator [Clostridia bacterium]MBQ3463575.1 MarR family transcriptional regulator [Clostridia bacterium]MBQ9599872.1 MarR family transcriptional regulator [Clostridia bacterium]
MKKKELIKKCCVLSDYLTMRLVRGCSFEGITHSEFMMLRMLVTSGEYNENLTVTMISDRINISKAAVSQMITQLESKNWVTRRTDANDKRLVYVCLTPEGQAAYESQLETIGHSMMEIFSELSVQDMQKLYDVLETISNKVRHA